MLVHCEMNWQKENVGTLSNKFEKENVSTLSKKFANRKCQYTVNEIYKMRMLVHCQINLHIGNVSTVHCQKMWRFFSPIHTVLHSVNYNNTLQFSWDVRKAKCTLLKRQKTLYIVNSAEKHSCFLSYFISYSVWDSTSNN